MFLNVRTHHDLGLDDDLEVNEVGLLPICACVESDHGVEVVPELLAGAAVDGQVEGTGEAHEGVDDEDHVVGHLNIDQSEQSIETTDQSELTS